jgi:hypothetical protein
VNPVCNKKPSIGLKRGTLESGDKLITQSSLKCRCNESKNKDGKESMVVIGNGITFPANKKLRLRLMAKIKLTNLNLNILNTN